MSQTFISPLEEYPGSITFPDGLTLKQVADWEKALGQVKQKLDNGKWVKDFCSAETWLLLLPIISGIVEKWEVQGIPEKPTVDNTLFKPYKRYRKFAEWVCNCTSAMFLGEDEIPKGLGWQSADG